jgi:CubicO group peptidase (beta-lactamase class C family)
MIGHNAPRWTLLVGLLTVAPASLGAQAAIEARIDSIFAEFDQPGTPGCALGVARDGQVLLERAWGLADLERSVANTPTTIFEAGSVSKQFTAAAILLLQSDGRLSLDDDVRRWMPELPDYGAPVTLRHLLHHTSGMRDWGSIAGIAGWPRNTRALSHDHVLAIIARVRELNFPPGTEYDYSNTNYNLLAMVAERASGMAFPELTRRRLFEPLGMTSTSWRDDAMRLVPHRALSYDRADSVWRSSRAIENIFGNCCLLTTVGDLLKWNAAFDSTRLGGPGLREEQERRGVLVNGRQISYAAGLTVGVFRGQPYVAHSGATSGYRAYAVRYPAGRLSVAVLCNAGTADPESMGDAVAALLIPFDAAATTAPPARAAVPPAAIADKAGLYRNRRDMIAQRLVLRDGRLHTESGTELIPESPTVFAAATGGNRVHFDRRRDGGYDLRIVTPAHDTVPADLVQEPDTSAAALAAFAGTYYSDEADATLTFEVDSTGALIGRRAPAARARLRPLYRDGFGSPIGRLVFVRDAAGGVTGLLLTTSRVRNLRFRRM